MKVKAKTVLTCPNCGLQVFACHECNVMFEEGDDILCREMIDERRHYHKDCV